MTRINLEISRLKGEIPLYVLLFIIWLFGGMIIYPYGLIWNFVFLIAIVAIVLALRGTGSRFFNRKYYIQADETGIAYRLGIFSGETKLIWELIDNIEVLMYEINFTLKSNGAVNSMPLSALNEEQQDELKKVVYLSFEAYKKE